MSNPNIFVTPTIRPPFPQWDATTEYFNGDVVTYAQQSWVCFSSLFPVIGKVPDQNQISINTRGILGATNPNGCCWLNLTLASPPAMPWSPSYTYYPGTNVAYPPTQPGNYWRSQATSFDKQPTINISSQPNNINTGIVAVQRLPIFPTVPFSPTYSQRNLTTGVSGPVQYWNQTEPLSGAPVGSA